MSRPLLYTMCPALFVLLLVAVAAIFLDVAIPDLTRDMAALADVHPLLGALSILGIMLWCAASVICLYTAVILFKRGRTAAVPFLLSASLLTAYLMIDDLFMLHEYMADAFLNLSERVMYAAIAIATLAHLLGFRRYILQTNYLMLLLALMLLGGSVLADVVEPWLLPRMGQWQYFLEDGFKWLGIATWLSYHAQASYHFLVAATDDVPASAPTSTPLEQGGQAA